jgi:hypothetical protein
MNAKNPLYRSLFASRLKVAVHPLSVSTMPRCVLIKLSNCFNEHAGVAHEAAIADASALSSRSVAKLKAVPEQH